MPAASSSSWVWWPCHPSSSQVRWPVYTCAAFCCAVRCPAAGMLQRITAILSVCHAEYCSRGSLYDCLAAAREHPVAAAQLTWRRRLSMAIDGGTGLLYLHRRNIIHRDGTCSTCNLCSAPYAVQRYALLVTHRLMPDPHPCLQSRAPTCWWTKTGTSSWQVRSSCVRLLPTAMASCPTVAHLHRWSAPAVVVECRFQLVQNSGGRSA